MALGMSMLLVVAGAVFTAPTASADEFTATVFSAPGWDYANIRIGPSLDDEVIDVVDAGAQISLGCWVTGDSAQGPYGISEVWYRISGRSGYISDAMLYTGSDAPVTAPCSEPGTDTQTPIQGRPLEILVATVFSAPGWDYANVRNGPGIEYDVVVATVPSASSVKVGCWFEGTIAEGPYGVSGLWYKAVEFDGYINDAMINTGSDEPLTNECDPGERPESPRPPEPPIDDPAQLPDNQIKRCPIPEMPNPTTSGRVEAGSSAAWDLHNHYYLGGGKPVIISWSYFLNNENFVKYIKQSGLKDVNDCLVFPGGSFIGGMDLYLALRNFTVIKTSESCYAIEDYYDFKWTEYPIQRFHQAVNWGYPFSIYSSGCFT